MDLQRRFLVSLPAAAFGLAIALLAVLWRSQLNQISLVGAFLGWFFSCLPEEMRNPSTFKCNSLNNNNYLKPNASRSALDKCADVNCKKKLQQDEDVKVKSSLTDNVVVKTVRPQVVENLKPAQTLTRSRSSRKSRNIELDLSPEALLIPPQSYTSPLLEDTKGPIVESELIVYDD
ncbi:hypothetical protein L195_g036190, partial [Trifolium pratense]